MAGWGKGDGSPHPRGQREEGKDIHPIPRLHGARLCARATGGGGLGVGDDRFFTPLRYVQNDMWGALRYGQSDMWVEGEDHPHPPSSRGQALTFPPQGGRELLV